MKWRNSSLRAGKYFEWIILQISEGVIHLGLRPLWITLLLDLQNSSYSTKAEFKSIIAKYLLEIIAYFYWIVILQTNKWKIESKASESAERKLQSSKIQGTVNQMKDLQPWSGSLKNAQVLVIEKTNNCALAHCSCKNIAENFDHYVIQTLFQNYSRQKLFQRSIAAPCWIVGI